MKRSKKITTNKGAISVLSDRYKKTCLKCKKGGIFPPFFTKLRGFCPVSHSKP